ncbi:DUF317 domain-containing protein [Streptomyces sp. NPDC048718]|uniref:DUF317 domain-containing protein n=1 Tax=Streptomyces sp. NPDC048718 TaxID=3365587 RepID=UPI003720912D
MPHAAADAHVRFALHPDHYPAVVATITGPTADAARSHLYEAGFRPTGPTTMVLARIDREEPYYTSHAKVTLGNYGFTTEITPTLQEEIDKAWTWNDDVQRWTTRSDARQLGAEAQNIHDTIADGRLVIHLHAGSGASTSAVGTYTDDQSHSVHILGENHFRHIDSMHRNMGDAIAEFRRLHSGDVRTGPAPLTDFEQTLRHLLTTPVDDEHGKEHTAPSAATPPAAGPGEHRKFVQGLLRSGSRWEEYRNWDGLKTLAALGDPTARVEFDHEARHRTDIAWTIAQYDGHVGERLWAATLTPHTPVALIDAALRELAASPFGGPADPTENLRRAGWHAENRLGHSTWTSPDRTITLARSPDTTDRWTLYGGDSPDQAVWAIRLSAGVSDKVLARLAGTAVGLVPSTPAPAPAPRPTPLPLLPATTPRPRTL